MVAAVLVWAALATTPVVVMAAGPPQIDASWVENVTPTGARLRADIDPNGFKTSFHFEYVTDAAYLVNGFTDAAKTPEQTAGAGGPPESQNLSLVLKPATTYHYRPVAGNEAGTTIGPEHALTTKEVGVVFQLLDGRAWEMVSPIDKGGGAVAAPGALFGGGEIQAAAAAPAITYGSATAFADPEGAPPASQYVSRRTPSGWIVENVSTPTESGAYGDEPDGAPYRLFSTDLSRGLLFGGLACLGGLAGCPEPNPPLPGSGAPSGYMAYYLRDGASDAVTSLLGPADVAHSSVSPQAFEVSFAAASPSLSHVVLSSCAALTADAIEVPAGPGECDGAAQNLYLRSAAGLEAINLLPGGTESTPGAAIATPIGAVSEDGSRVYWTQGGDLYLREGTQTAQVDESIGGGGTFQTASADGTIAFLTKAGHLYRYDAIAKATADLTPGGGVLGVLGASASGDTVYYQDSAGLKRWRSDATTLVAPGADAAAPSDYPPATGTARVSADGLHLAFLSKVELSGFDNVDAGTGQPDTLLYLYGPPPGGGAPALLCPSCNPTGERPRGSSTIPGALVNGTTLAYRPRVLSSGGNRVFFDSEDALVLQDTNSAPDVYEWEARGVGDCGRSPGCVNLISSGRESRGGATFLDASADGSDAFFLTNESLVAADPGSIDVYDARVGGGIPEAPKPIICIGDNCQPLPSPPDDPTPGTLVPNAGNPPLRVFGPRRKRAKLRLGKKTRRHGQRRGGGRRQAGRGR